MAEPRQLANPPITEALVDFRIVASHEISLERLRPLGAELRSLYPKSDEKRQYEAEFRIEGGKLSPPTAKDLGFRGLWLTSSDGTRVVQFRSDGFTFNNVGPGSYMGGEALIEEALRLWIRFAEVAKPSTVIRLALRYLNRLDLPMSEGDEFKRFLVAAPELPEPAPQRISAFLSRIVSHDETGAVAIVTQKLEHVLKFPLPVLVDVDVIFSQELDPSADKLRHYLEILRTVKNQAFFALLTEETVKLYE